MLEQIQPGPIPPVHYDVTLPFELYEFLGEGVREVALSDGGAGLGITGTFWRRAPISWYLAL